MITQQNDCSQKVHVIKPWELSNVPNLIVPENPKRWKHRPNEKQTSTVGAEIFSGWCQQHTVTADTTTKFVRAQKCITCSSSRESKKVATETKWKQILTWCWVRMMPKRHCHCWSLHTKHDFSANQHVKNLWELSNMSHLIVHVKENNWHHRTSKKHQHGADFH